MLIRSAIKRYQEHPSGDPETHLNQLEPPGFTQSVTGQRASCNPGTHLNQLKASARAQTEDRALSDHPNWPLAG